MIQLVNYIIISTIFNLLVNFPIVIYKTLLLDIKCLNLAIECGLIFILNNILFHLIIFSKNLRIWFTVFLFTVAGISNYFLVTHRKILDAGVIIDFISVESDLAKEYLDYQLIIVAIIFGLFGYWLATRKFNKNNINKKFC